MPDTSSPELAAPLDAYQTAKPSEPVWTVQGGDPLGAPLLRIWAVWARIRAGVIVTDAPQFVFEELRKAAQAEPPENDRERKALLIRASQTEDVSWDMDSYRRGELAAPEAKISEEKSLDEEARLDLHDRRVKAAQSINDMIARLVDIEAGFDKEGFDYEGSQDDFTQVRNRLRTMSAAIEPRRIFKR